MDESSSYKAFLVPGFIILLGLGIGAYVLFGSQEPWTPGTSSSSLNTTLLSYGTAIGLEPEAFSACLDADSFMPRIEAERTMGESIGVNSTPSYVINGAILRNATAETLKAAIAQVTTAGAATPLKIDAQYGVRSGSPTAPVQVVEFADFDCPACKQAASTHDQAVLAPLIAENKIYFVFMNFPLTPLPHPNAKKLAEAYLCADAQGKAQAMHDKLFAEQGNRTKD